MGRAYRANRRNSSLAARVTGVVKVLCLIGVYVLLYN